MNTNIVAIRDVAKTLLYLDVDFDETFTFIAHHPFFGNSVYPAHDENGVKLLDLNIPEELDKARSIVSKLIDKVQNVFEFAMLINKPYLPAFFKLAYPYMSKQDYAEFLSDLWVRVEFPNADANISKAMFVDLFKKADKKFLMSENENAVLDNLPDDIVIYRGVYGDGRVEALSWTLNEEKADWFANRWDGSGDVYRANIAKEDVLAYFDSRGEAEVVVDYRKLRNIQHL